MAELNEYDSVNGVSDEEMTRRFQEAVRLANERKRIKGLPIQKYDIDLKKPYLEYPNGERKYAEEAWNNSFCRS